MPSSGGAPIQPNPNTQTGGNDPSSGMPLVGHPNRPLGSGSPFPSPPPSSSPAPTESVRPNPYPSAPQNDVTVRFVNYSSHWEYLDITTGADQIVWSYGLNTQSYPTYGGEVVQILSAYIDDFSITGTVASYAKLEEIYRFFLKVLQTSTQGSTQGPAPYQAEGPNFPTASDFSAYNIQPITFIYAERGWKFDIIPKSLPMFHYGRDVVAPTWSLTGAVHQADTSFKQLIIQKGQAAIDSLPWEQAKAVLYGQVTADIGYNPNNQYQVPVDPQTHKALGTPSTSGLPKEVSQIVDFFNNTVLSAYLNNTGDITTLVPDYSQPTKGTGSSGSSTTGKTGKTGKGSNVSGGVGGLL